MDNYDQEPSLPVDEPATSRRETAHPFTTQNLTSVKGRMGRLDFAILSFSLMLLVLLIQKTLGINQFLVGFSAYTEEEIISKALLKTAIMIGLVELVVFSAISIKRLHDINYSGWMALLFIAPLVNLGPLSGILLFIAFIIRLILLFAKGEPHKNRFGDVPVGNHRNKLFLLLGILVLLYLTFSHLFNEALPIIGPIMDQMRLDMQQ